MCLEMEHKTVALEFEPGATSPKQFQRREKRGFILPITGRPFWKLIRRWITSEVC